LFEKEALTPDSHDLKLMRDSMSMFLEKTGQIDEGGPEVVESKTSRESRKKSGITIISEILKVSNQWPGTANVPSARSSTRNMEKREVADSATMRKFSKG